MWNTGLLLKNLQGNLSSTKKVKNIRNAIKISGWKYSMLYMESLLV